MSKECKSEWYDIAEICDHRGCSPEFKCSGCQPNGVCDICDTIDGRWMQAVNEYASTCDWCSELTAHVEMKMNDETQLGYCKECENEMIKLEENDG